MHFIRLRLTDAAGKLLSENFYWRSNRLGDYRALNGLEPARLDVRSKEETVGAKRIVRTTVTNRGRGVAFAVRVMPTYASRRHGRQLFHAPAGREADGDDRVRRRAARGGRVPRDSETL